MPPTVLGYHFAAPLLNGHPINIPNKIDMIDWYSRIIECFEDQTEDEGRNSVIRNLRLHGDILYNDEFYAEHTADYDNISTIGRVERIVRALDMVRRYKAACEDGADLSTSIIHDFSIVFNDGEGRKLHRETMHNHRRVLEEIQNRRPENCPIRAFWMALSIYAAPITSQLQQIATGTMNVFENPTATVNDLNHTPGQPLSGAINPQNGSQDPSRPLILFDPTTPNFVPRPDYSSRAASGPLLNSLDPTAANFIPQPNCPSPEAHSPLLDSFDPTAADFIPRFNHSTPTAQSPLLRPLDPTNPDSNPRSNLPPRAARSETASPTVKTLAGGTSASRDEAAVSPDTALTMPDLNILEMEFVEDFNDEYWEDDEIFIPIFCRSLFEQILASRAARPEAAPPTAHPGKDADTDTNAGADADADTNADAGAGVDAASDTRSDSGCYSM